MRRNRGKVKRPYMKRIVGVGGCLACRGSVVENWQLKPEVSWVWLLVTAGFVTFLYFRLTTSKIQNLEIDAQRGTDTLELGSLPTFGFWKLLYEIFSFRCLLTDHKYYLWVKFQCMWWSATYQFFNSSIVAKKGPRPGSLDSMLFQNLVRCVCKAGNGEGTDKG